MNFFINKITSVKLQEKEIGISRHLPFAYLDENDIVRTKNGDYLIILKIEGISCDTLDDSAINFEQDLRAKLFTSFSDPRFALYHTVIRKKTTIQFSNDCTIPIAKEVIADYHTNLNQQNLFTNNLYLTILFKGVGSNNNRITSRLKQWLENFSHQLYKEQARKIHSEAIKILNEVVLQFTISLAKYQVHRLGLVSEKKGEFSEQLRFFSELLNWDDEPILAAKNNISQYIPKRRLFFGAKGIESQGNSTNHSKFAAMISVKEYPHTTYPGIIDPILELPIEMIITQSFCFQNRQASRTALELQLRRLRQAQDPDQKGRSILEQALGDLVAGEFGFGFHHFTIMVQAPTLEILEKNIATVEKHLTESGLIGIRERLNIEAAFWAQFPGNFQYIVRKLPITTNNFASLCSLQGNPQGQKTGNHWGEAITLLKTQGHQPYYFNFHQPKFDVGHTLIFGTTGCGKTLLACFLILNSLKFNTRVFYFDKDHGAEAFIRAIGGDHATVGHGKSAGLNPLQLPDTLANRRFLYDWLQSLLTATGDLLSSDDLERIHHAVRLNYEYLTPRQRTLQNLAEAFGRGGPTTLRNRIDQWHSDGHLAEFFGSEADQLRFNNDFFCFEMKHLLEKANDITRPSVLFYIFYRIQLALENNSRSTIICLDEAWLLLDNPLFATHIRNWLKTFRKRNAVVILLSQELMDISKSSISESIIAETATKIFFPDKQPNKEIYREVFQLSEREIHLLKFYSKERSYFLIKQAQESVFAKLDLTGLSRWIPIMSGNSSSVQILHTLLQQNGENPEHWLSHYLAQTNDA